MRKIVSPLDGIRSPITRTNDVPALNLISGEQQGFAIEFIKNTYAVRTT